VPREGALGGDGELLDKVEEMAEHLLSLEWKVYDIVVVPVKEIDIPSPSVYRGSRAAPGGAPHDSSLSGSR
jgi:hypothetical protein